MANPTYNYSTALGTYMFPNEAQAIVDTPLPPAGSGIAFPDTSSILRDVPTTPNQSVLGSLTDAATSPISSAVTWFENGISGAFVRGGVVILGFILIAAGLYAFSNHEINVMVKK